MIRRSLGFASLAVALAFTGLVASCKDEATCRPGTLFIKLTLNAAAEGADQLHIVVATDVRREITVPYPGGTSLQVEFPADAYPAGANADIVVEALKSGVVVATAQQQGFTLPKSCGALSLTFGGSDNSDLSIGDLAGADFSGVDLSATAPDLAGEDLLGADLTEGPDMTGPTVLANGAACTMSEQCASGFCVDGYCCDSSCDGQCQACDVSTNLGLCVGINGTPHGTRAACNGTGACGGTCVATTPNVCTYPGAAVTCREPSCAAAVKTLAEVCDGAGSCPAASTFNCPSSACNAGNTDCLGACTTNTECMTSTPSTPYCNLPEGVCRATKDEGESCTDPGDCTSGFCVDGFCCNVACTGSCQACSLTTSGNKPGTCATVTSGQPVTDKGTTRAACNGSGTCKGSCDGTSPTACGYPGAGVDCGTTCSCNNGSNSCSCSSTCALAAKTPKKCDGAGACGTQAAVGCAANVCNAGATDCGTCTADVDCGSGRYCDGGNICRVKKANGAACSNTNGDHECVNNHCVGGTCCATTCGGTTPACKADGSKCVCTGGSCGSLTCLNDACCDNTCPTCRDAASTNGCGNACTKNCNTVCQGGSCCVAESDATFCARLGKNCNNVTAADNCGAQRTVNCGTCMGANTCGGGPPGSQVANVCGCTPESTTAFCLRLGKNCPFTGADNCGTTRNNVPCGTCSGSNPDCSSGVCTCVPSCDPAACSAYVEAKCGTTCNGNTCGSCSSCGGGSCVNRCCATGGLFDECQCGTPSGQCMFQ